MLRVDFLGTSAAQPTLHRGLSGIAVRHDGNLFLVDCGEGSQRQMIRFNTGFDLAAVFLTHFHADHYLGLLGLVRTLAMQGIVDRLPVYGPSPGRRVLERMLRREWDDSSLPVDVHDLAPGDTVRLDTATIQAFPTDHRVPSLGYALVEDARPGRFHPESALALGVEYGRDFGRLQSGRTITTASGRVVEPSDVMDPPRPGRRVVFSGDTRPCSSTLEVSRGADLLVHEATFAESERERAVETRHTTAREAALLAREAQVRRLVLTHLSTRYDTCPEKLLDEARQAFDAVTVAHDGLRLEIPFPEEA